MRIDACDIDIRSDLDLALRRSSRLRKGEAVKDLLSYKRGIRSHSSGQWGAQMLHQ